MRTEKPKVAFCGTRGVPANYGGFETAVDEISRRFVKAGYDCEVFCRRSAGDYRPAMHNGRRLTYVNGHPSRVLDTFVAAIQTGRLIRRKRKEYDHIFWFNNANLPGILMTVLARVPLSVNTDGLEWRRAKWSWPFKAYYWLSSFLIARLCRNLISDSHGIRDYYRRRMLKRTSFVPYGAPAETSVGPKEQKEILRKFGLESGQYLLQITRIEPDNLPLQVAAAFARSNLPKSGYRLVVVGYKDDTPYARRLISFDGRGGIQIREAIYDPVVLTALRENCFCYVHGNSVGGTNPALLEAMASCPRIMAIDSIFSREVLAETGAYFAPQELVTALNGVPEMPNRARELRHRVREHYAWDAVAQSYMNMANGNPADYAPLRTRDGHRERIDEFSRV